MERYGEIYIITNKINGKQYVGQTVKKVRQRFTSHVFDSRRSDTRSGLHSAIKKHGIENFEVQSFATCTTSEELNRLEIHMIAELKTLSPNGYNLMTGGNKNHKHSPESIALMSKSKTGNYTEKQRQGSASRRGKPLSQETLDKMSKALKGRPPSKETIEAANRAKHKPIIDSNGVSYPSVKAAAEALGLNHSKISAVLNGRRKTTGGYTFQ